MRLAMTIEDGFGFEHFVAYLAAGRLFRWFL